MQLTLIRLVVGWPEARLAAGWLAGGLIHLLAHPGIRPSAWLHGRSTRSSPIPSLAIYSNLFKAAFAFELSAEDGSYTERELQTASQPLFHEGVFDFN